MNVKTLSDYELEKLLANIIEEQNKRKKTKYDKLIEDFETAFKNLQENWIEIRLKDEDFPINLDDLEFFEY